MAGLGVPGDQIVVQQVEDIGKALGLAPEVLAKNVDVERQLLSAVKTAPNAEAASEGVRKVHSDLRLPPPGAAEIVQLTNPNYRSLLRYDPAPVLKSLKQPLLAIGGSKDIQVKASTNLPAVKAADPRATTIELPGLNHLFQTANTGAVEEYGYIAETMAPAALKVVGDWIVQVTGAKAP